MSRISLKKTRFVTLPVILPVKPVSWWFETPTTPQFGPSDETLQKTPYS